ncbi:hypothetical protein ACTXT7_012836 [Hymenolepis weldensis]
MQSSVSRSAVQLNTEIKETEAQSKFFNERVSQIEVYFGDLCAEFISYAKRTAKLRNNGTAVFLLTIFYLLGDELSKILLNYSVNEKINRTTARTLKQFAELLSLLEDYRHAEVDRLLAKVIIPLSTYGDEVKRIRTNIKVETAARKKEVSQLKRLSRDPHKGSDDRINNATRDALRSAEALENHVVQFEAKKLKGLKTAANTEILTDFVHIEMLWHAKALETLTNAFNVVQALQEDVDLADFRNTLFRSGTSASLNANVRQAESVPVLHHHSDHQENLVSVIKTLPNYDGSGDIYDEDYGAEEVEFEEDFDEEYENGSENEESEEEEKEEEEVSDSSMEDDSVDVVEQSDTRKRPEKPKLSSSTPLKSALKQSQQSRAR